MGNTHHTERQDYKTLNPSFEVSPTCIQILTLGTWLVVQWLRLHIPSAGGLGSIPGQGTKARMPQLRVYVAQGREKTQHGQNHQIPTLSLPGSESLLDCFLFCKTDIKHPPCSVCTELRQNPCKLLATCEHETGVITVVITRHKTSRIFYLLFLMFIIANTTLLQ